MDIYFVTIGKIGEKKTIKKVKPDNILISYYYWKNKSINKLINYLGYKPNIMLDSGAYSAWNKNQKININNYIEYIKNNIEFINNYIILDVIENPKQTLKNLKYMKNKGLNPIPVFHHGDKISKINKLKQYNDLIALGNTVPIKNKKHVARWVNQITKQFPDVDFHLLGSSSKNIIRKCPRLKSCDSTEYFMGAIFGRPKYIEGKINKAVYNMRKTLKINNKEKVEQLSLIQ